MFGHSVKWPGLFQLSAVLHSSVQPGLPYSTLLSSDLLSLFNLFYHRVSHSMK